MNFSHLVSLYGTAKQALNLRSNSSLRLAAPRTTPYIEPSFQKVEFRGEKPPILLIAAVGASGKSALAQVLGNKTSMPVLDLSKHKAVGDSTVSGLLTNSFAPAELGKVFAGIANGEFGLIVDGLDEGRAKTTEQAFEAFLDDVVNLCKDANRPTFVLLGRTTSIEACWVYLEDRGVKTGLLTIAPFGEKQANSYIDQLSGNAQTTHGEQYALTKSAILSCLSNAFASSNEDNMSGGFISFIGYPPVLDAIATLLDREKNFHKLRSELISPSSSDKEVKLLAQVCTFIMERERSEKIWASILPDLVAAISKEKQEPIQEDAYSVEEQASRLLSYCMHRELSVPVFHEPVLDMQYEERVRGFLEEHPFIEGRSFRNAVFESFCMAQAFFSTSKQFQDLAIAYAETHRPTYHLVYMVGFLANGRAFPLESIRALLAAAQDFRARQSYVDIEIDGMSGDLIDLEVGITSVAEYSEAVGTSRQQFSIHCSRSSAEPINLGDSLADAYISIPADLVLSSASEIRLVEPVELTCMNLNLQAPTLSAIKGFEQGASGIIFNCLSVTSLLHSITKGVSEFRISVVDRQGVTYPLSDYIDRAPLPDEMIREKYLRLRRILTHFRSHSKGQLAKFADKVEHERVGGNKLGSAILSRLLHDQVLYKDGIFYFVEPERIGEYLGVSYNDLKNGVVTEKLINYLAKIEITLP